MIQNPYLQLLRISNVFTVPPDILVGYFALYYSSNQLLSPAGNFFDLVILIFSSIFLYLGGLVSNDLFDLKIDKAERPNRPLPSGTIKTSNALILSTILFGLGLILSAFINVTAISISILLTVGILVYNYKLKNGLFRPYLMGGIRALNVIYGASVFLEIQLGNLVISVSDINNNNINSIGSPVLEFTFDSIAILALAAISVFVHIFTVTLLSSRETAQELSGKKEFKVKKIQFSYLAFLLIVGTFGTTILPYKPDFVVFFIFFSFLISFVYYKAYKKLKLHSDKKEQIIQFIVKNMILFLIVLDSAFLAGESGYVYGLLTASLIVPSVFLGKKISMT